MFGLFVAILIFYGLYRLIKAAANSARNQNLSYQNYRQSQRPSDANGEYYSLNARERKIYKAASICNEHISAMETSDYIPMYFSHWNRLCEDIQKLQEIKPTFFVAKHIEDMQRTTIESFNKFNGEVFQWYLRNAIERQKDGVVKTIKTTYRNSQYYQQKEIDSFVTLIRAYSRYYNDETNNFVEYCIADISRTFVPQTKFLQFQDDAAAYERSLLTPSLRYKILQRDKMRCTICGRGQEDGVKLHVDHIKPVSKGGRTVPENLRTLCQDCNLGKSDSYVEGGYN